MEEVQDPIAAAILAGNMSKTPSIPDAVIDLPAATEETEEETELEIPAEEKTEEKEAEKITEPEAKNLRDIKPVEEEKPPIEISPEDFNELIENQYGVKSQDIKTILSDYQTKSKEVEALKKELEAKVEFKDENQKKLFDFVSRYNGEDLRGFEDFVRIQNLDISSLDDKSALREDYVMKHKDLSREDALKKFERHYYKNYEVDEEDAEMVRIDAKTAKSSLEKIKAEVKAQPVTKKEIVPATNESFEKNKPAYLSELSKEMTGFDKVIHETPNGKVYFPLEKEEIQEIDNLIKGIINDPHQYTEDGRLRTPISQLKEMAPMILLGKEMMQAMYKQGLADKEIKLVKDRAAQVPKQTTKAIPAASRAKDVGSAIEQGILEKARQRK